MPKSKIIKNALINVLAATAYIVLVATLLENGNKLFGPDDNAFSPIAFLLLFVFSASVMGVTLLGRPILWYLDGFKKESINLILYTLGFLFVITFIVLSILIILK